MSKLTIEERVRNAAASQEVENIKARHTYYHGRADATGEWGNIWSWDRNSAWGHVFGRMRGRDQVWYGSVTNYDRKAMQNWLDMVDFYPEVGGKDPRPLMEASVHTLCTDIIEVAEDGLSARGHFVTPGVIHSRLTPDHAKYCMVLWESYGADFVYEDGRWLYLHEQVVGFAGSQLDYMNFSADNYQIELHPERRPNFDLPTNPPVSDPPPVYNTYGLLESHENWIPWPEPYKTLDNDNTYAPLFD